MPLWFFLKILSLYMPNIKNILYDKIPVLIFQAWTGLFTALNFTQILPEQDDNYFLKRKLLHIFIIINHENIPLKLHIF